MARSRFGISRMSADEGRDGSESGEPAEDFAPPGGSAPTPEPRRPEAEEWSVEAANRASTDAGSSPESAEEWLPGGEPEGAVTSIAAMGAAAEELAAGSEAPSLSERDLEPPAWVTGEPEGTAEAEPAESWAAREPDPEPEPAPEPEPTPAPEPQPSAAQPAEEANGKLSLSSADFDALRGLGMSVTQAKRVLRYREQRGGFADLDELERVPGFPREFLAEIRDRVVP